MSFNCLRCLKSFKTKWHIKRHNDRKIPCKVVDFKDGKPKVNIAGLTKNKEKNSINECKKIYICMYCNKEYNYKQSKQCIKKIFFYRK